MNSTLAFTEVKSARGQTDHDKEFGQTEEAYILTQGGMCMSAHMGENALTNQQITALCVSIKIGVYKSLHEKGLLTDSQLNSLINQNRKDVRR